MNLQITQYVHTTKEEGTDSNRPCSANPYREFKIPVFKSFSP